MYIPTYFRQRYQTLFKLNKLEKMSSISTKSIALIYHYAKENAELPIEGIVFQYPYIRFCLICAGKQLTV